MTWSERQALAKKKQGEEEARNRSAAYVAPAASPVSKPVFQSSAPALERATASWGAPINFGGLPPAGGVVAATATVGAAAAVGVSTAGVIAARDAVQAAAWGTEEEPEPEQPEHEQPEPEEPAEVEEVYEPPV